MAKWKQLRSVANNIASQFANSCEHFDFMMNENDVNEVRIDPLAETVSHNSFDIYCNIKLVQLCSRNLKDLLHREYGKPVNEVVLTMTKTASDRLSDIELTIRTADGRTIVGHP